uniref:Peptidase S1 domain-containing protein n=1 Tax=Syphacia muris TaxID=451379 RepID=A0A0N5AYB6_9BILA
MKHVNSNSFGEEGNANISTCGESLFFRGLDNLNDYYQVSGNRLVGAKTAHPNAWPWTVQIVWCNGAHHCGGALIDRSFVVTAAHCFSRSRNPRNYNVLLGGHEAGSGEVHIVRNISIHPFFRPEHPSSYDVAVVRIHPPANFSTRIQKICLPVLPVPENKICIVTGWGRSSENGNRSNSLQEIHVPIISTFVCNDFYHYKGQVHLLSMMCAGFSSGGIDACQGDSGGPLFCEINRKWELHGVVSWGYGCARPNSPGVYSRIIDYVPWIRQQMLFLY